MDVAVVAQAEAEAAVRMGAQRTLVGDGSEQMAKTSDKIRKSARAGCSKQYPATHNKFSMTMRPYKSSVFDGHWRRAMMHSAYLTRSRARALE